MNKQIGHIATAHLLLFSLAAGYFFLSRITSTTCGTVNSYTSVSSEIPVPLSANAAKGKVMFQAKCAACHNIYKDMTGPALTGFESRGPWSNRKELYRWVRNPQGFMEANLYTQELKKRFPSIMTPFDNLTDGEIDLIVAYINEGAQQQQRALP